MSTINLEKELVKKNEQRKVKLQEFGTLSEVKLLLEHTEQEELNVLRGFKLDDHIRRVEEERGKLIETEKFETEYGNSHQVDDIASICVRYRLRFLPLSKFKGAIDPLLASKIVAFGKQHNIDPVQYADNFYVAAPAEDFRMEETKHRKPMPRPVVSMDPLLFYKTDREGQFWTLIHKWGSEFTVTRLFRSLKYRNEAFYVAHWSMMLTAVILLAFTGLVGGYTFPFWALTLISAVLGTIGGFIKYGCLSEADEANLFSERNWSDASIHKMVEWNE